MSKKVVALLFLAVSAIAGRPTDVVPSGLRDILLEMSRIGGADQTRASQLRMHAIALVKENPAGTSPLLEDEDPEVVLGALSVMVRAAVVSPPPSVYDLAARSPVAGIRYNALLLVANGPPAKASATLLGHLGIHCEDISFVVEAMQQHPRDEYVPFLGSLAWSDPEGPATVRAISALGGTHSIAARCMLLSLLAHPDAEIGKLAAYAIRAFPPEDMDVLKPFLDDTRDNVKAAAVLVLPSLQDRGVKSMLLGYTQDESASVQSAAAEALGDLGTNSVGRLVSGADRVAPGGK